MSRILLVSSVGGHLDEVMQLAPALAAHDVSLVINDTCELPSFPFVNVYRVAHAERDWRVLLNVAEAAKILRVEDPDVMLSAGAGVVVPFALLVRALGRARVVYIETAAAVNRPSLTGRIMYPLAHNFYYQWSALSRVYPRGTCHPLAFP